MKTTYFRNDSLATLLLGAALMCASEAAFAQHYGRAGGQVGVAAIEQIVRDARVASESDARLIVFGQAGQPVGADAIAYVNKHAKRSRFNDERAAAWFGRSGGAIGIERPREDAAMRFADQAK